MPYCRKCGAKLEENARFCHVCGTPAVAVTSVPATHVRRRPFFLPVAILVAVLLTAVVVSALVFLPFYSVHFDQTNRVATKAGVDNLNLDFQADVANVNVFFKNLSGNMVVMNVTADGYTGILSDPNRTVAVTFDQKTANHTAIVTSRVSRAEGWPLSYNLNVVCDIYIDPSVRLTLSVRSTAGQISMNAHVPITLNGVHLQATTGSVEANLTQGVVIAGGLSLGTTTGSVRFNMDRAEVSGNILATVQSTTGSVNVNVVGNERLSGNMTLNAGTATGAVNLGMVIRNNIGALIDSSNSFGGISVEQQQGFQGNQSLLQSTNYPAENNFLVSLRTTTGGININAIYESSATRS
jgi:hypothetical protein